MNHAMRHGCKVGEVSAYLGHESTSTTYRYYWTATVHEEVNRVLEEPEESVLERLRGELATVHEAIARTGCQIDRILCRRPPPPPRPNTAGGVVDALNARLRSVAGVPDQQTSYL